MVKEPTAKHQLTAGISRGLVFLLFLFGIPAFSAGMDTIFRYGDVGLLSAWFILVVITFFLAFLSALQPFRGLIIIAAVINLLTVIALTAVTLLVRLSS